MPKSASASKKDPEEIPKRLPPARTRERRMMQLGNMAEALVEERMRTGVASPTEITAVLRYTSTLEEANLARIKAQTAYLEAQRAKAESETVRQDLFEKAMAAFKEVDPNPRD